MSRPAGSYPARFAVAGHARLVRICRAAAVTEARAQYNESWTIHRVNGDTSITSKSKSVFLSFLRVCSIRVSHKRCILFYSACLHVYQEVYAPTAQPKGLCLKKTALSYFENLFGYAYDKFRL